jgi:hypothetical protein
MHTEEKEAPLPDIESLRVELASLIAKVNALHHHHNKLVETLDREFKEKNLSARLGQLEKRHESLGERIAAVEESGTRYSGVYQRANGYRRGEWVGYDGSGWVALSDVQPLEQPGASPKWQLVIRAGRDGRDAQRSPTKGSRGPPEDHRT